VWVSGNNLPAAPTDDRPLPDFAELHTQLKRKGVTLALLWEEYKALTPEGLQYSQFCERYRRYSARVDLVMRQPHRAGEKRFILYLLTAGRPARPVRRLRRADGAGRRPRYR
jgi:transposase